MRQTFDGETYDADIDQPRLAAQLDRVFSLMRQTDTWWTLRDIATRLELPESSVSARLRDLRKPRFGRSLVDRRRIHAGLYKYRLTPNFRMENLLPTAFHKTYGRSL